MFFKFIWNVLNPFVIRNRKVQKHMHIDLFQIILINSSWGLYLLFFTEDFVSYQKSGFAIFSLLLLKIVFLSFFIIWKGNFKIFYFQEAANPKLANDFLKRFKIKFATLIQNIKHRIKIYHLFYKKIKTKAKKENDFIVFLLIRYFLFKLK